MTTNRSVVIRVAIDVVVDVPNDWDTEAIEFFFNGSSHCINNELRALHDHIVSMPGVCDTCARSSTTFVRNATDYDEYMRRPGGQVDP